MMRMTRFVLAAFAIAMLSACAAPAEPGRMVPETVTLPQAGYPSNLRGHIAIGAIGGGEMTDAMGLSKVASDDLREALRITLSRNGMLSEAKGAERYTLDAFLIELKQPAQGYTLNVRAFVRYQLTRVSDRRLLLEEIIDGSYRATFEDSVIGIERLRIANEGAVRQSIAALLATLERLDRSELPEENVI